jgi:hypothetical protein
VAYGTQAANQLRSVYVYAISRARPPDQRQLDYYLAPEVLAAEFGQEHPYGPPGEGFSSDVYALGLVLFECLVRILTREELRRFLDPTAYKIQEHEAWIEKLRLEIQKAYNMHDLCADEFLLLRNLIVADPRRRPSDLDEAVEMAKALALVGGGLKEKLKRGRLIAFTTLNFREEYCIKNFLQREIDISGIEEAPDKLAALVQEELNGAYVYHNSADKERPLLLVGKRVAFTAKPFEWNQVVYKRFAFIEVARNYMRPDGSPLAQVGEVEIRGLDYTMSLTPLLSAGESWQDLFTMVENQSDGLGLDQRRFHRTLSLSVELEKKLWEKWSYAYQVVERAEDSDQSAQIERIAILQRKMAGDDNRLSMADALLQQLDREVAGFDLSRSADPTAPFREECRWYLVGIKDDGRILLERRKHWGNEDAPEQGFVRPWSLAGSRILYQRRQELLRHLADDAYLLRSVTSPWTVAHDLGATEIRLFDEQLDCTKRKLVEQIRVRRPFFTVQGPPGTGKTMLAREVVLQTLDENPSARILITSQAHEPLNNLLDKVEESLEKYRRRWGHREKPLSVRLLSEERLSVSRYGEEGTRVGRDYHPSKVAALHLENAAAWKPDLESIEDPKVVQEWRQFLAQQKHAGLSASLEERIINSANLVYATANDRHIARFKEDSFDLVIIEEAARAYAIELLAPMRLARRWLLIGDQQQLPPFGIEDFEPELNRYVKNATIEHSSPLLGSQQFRGIPALLGYSSAEELSAALSQTVQFFAYLHGAGEKIVRRPLSGKLDTQWRMHPDIGSMVAVAFYPNLLKNGKSPELRKKRHFIQEPKEIRNSTLVWLDVPHVNYEPLAEEEPGFGGGFTNGYEARALLGFFKELRGTRKVNTVLLSPYRAQVNVLNDLFRTWDHPVTGPLTQRAFTVDSFQGRQTPLIAISLVRNNKETDTRRAIGFLENMQRSTVMFSRAESLLVVVGCSEHFRHHPRSWVNHIFDYVEREGVVLNPERYIRPEDEQRMRSSRKPRRA